MVSVENEAVEGGWRALCIGMMVQAVIRMKEEKKINRNTISYRLRGCSGLDKEILHQKAYAKDWIEGGIGQITFEECCESIGVDAARAREKIYEYCQKTWRKPRRN